MKKKIYTTIACLMCLNILFAQTPPNYVPTNGLVGWWPFNGNANDESGNGNNGTVTNATLATDRNNNLNKSYYFNQNGSRIEVPNNPNIFPDSFSISAWFKFSSHSFIMRTGDGNLDGWKGWIITTSNQLSGDSLQLQYWDMGGGTYRVYEFKSTKYFKINVWNQLTITRTPITLQLFLNGQLAGTLNNLQPYSKPSTTALVLGNNHLPFDDYARGNLDDIGIWNRALTQQEITALYTGATCTPTTSTTNISICPTVLPYSWNGLIFNTAGSKTAHLTNAAGCDSAATLNLSINAQPTPAANNVCVGSTLQLTNATNGGVWASANNRATVNATGLVTGANAGGAVITYKKNGVTTNYNITVNAIPNVPSIVYAASAINPQLGASRGEFCINKTFGIVGIPAGGVFTTGNNAIVTINCSGIVNTVGLGNSAINYRYTNAKGCSNSRTMVGTVVNCAARGVAINEKLATTNEFSLYPNPAKSIVNLNIDCLVGAGSIVVTDLYGKQVKTQTLSMGTNTIDISNLSKGMYFVSTITNEGKTTKKLVVE